MLLEHRDTNINPGTDFSIRQWFMDQKNDIPAEESAWGIGNLVVDEINEKLKKSAKMLKIKKFQKEIHFD